MPLMCWSWLSHGFWTIEQMAEWHAMSVEGRAAAAQQVELSMLSVESVSMRWQVGTRWLESD
jgi:hypothetical protein